LRRAKRLTLKELGSAQVSVYEYSDHRRVLFDLRRDLERVTVQILDEHQSRSCDVPHPTGGWRCTGRPEWNRVTPTDLRVAGRSWPSVWAHPVLNQTLRLNLGAQILGDYIEFEAALSDWAVRKPDGGPVEIRIEIDGQSEQAIIRPNTSGILTQRLPTPAAQGEVVVLITTEQGHRRHLGINVRIIKERQQR